MASTQQKKPSDPSLMSLPQEIRLRVLAEVLADTYVQTRVKHLDKPKRVIDPVKEFNFYPLHGDMENPTDSEREWRRLYVPLYEPDYVSSGITEILSINKKIYHELTDVLRWKTKVTFSFHSSVALFDVLLGDLRFPFYRGPDLSLIDEELARDKNWENSLAAQVRHVHFNATPLSLHGAFTGADSSCTLHHVDSVLALLNHAGLKLDNLVVFDRYLFNDDGWGRRAIVEDMRNIMAVDFSKSTQYVSLQPYLQEYEVADLANLASKVEKRRWKENKTFQWILPGTPTQFPAKATEKVDKSSQEQKQDQQGEQGDPDMLNLPEDPALAAQVLGQRKKQLLAAYVHIETGETGYVRIDRLRYSQTINALLGNKDEEEQKRRTEANGGVLPPGMAPIKYTQSAHQHVMGPFPTGFRLWPERQEVQLNSINPSWPVGSRRIIFHTNTSAGVLAGDAQAHEDGQLSVMCLESIPLRPQMSAEEREEAMEGFEDMTWEEKYCLHRDKIGWGENCGLTMQCTIAESGDGNAETDVAEKQGIAERARRTLTPVMYSLMERMSWREMRESMDYLNDEGTEDPCASL